MSDTLDGVGVDFGAGFKLALGDLTDELRQQNQREDARNKWRQRNMPIQGAAVAQGVGVTAQNLFLAMAKPMLGRFIEVRSIAVGGSLITSTPAGQAFVMAAANNPPTDLATINLRDNSLSTSAFPAIAFYGTRQLCIMPGEHLVVVIVGPTNGVQYVVNMEFLEYPLEAYSNAVEL